jgi:hypothetical protein
MKHEETIMPYKSLFVDQEYKRIMGVDFRGSPDYSLRSLCTLRLKNMNRKERKVRKGGKDD